MAAYYNNVGVLALALQEYRLALKSFKLAGEEVDAISEEEDHQLLYCVIHNNLGVLYTQFGKRDKAEQMLYKSVHRAEVQVFTQINRLSHKELRKSPLFLQQLQILIYAYIYYDRVQERERKTSCSNLSSPAQPIESGAPACKGSKFIENAVTLAQRYLGEQHPLTKKLQCYKYNLSECRVYEPESTRTFNFNADNFRLWKLLHGIRGESLAESVQKQQSMARLQLQ